MIAFQFSGYTLKLCRVVCPLTAPFYRRIVIEAMGADKVDAGRRTSGGAKARSVRTDFRFSGTILGVVLSKLANLPRSLVSQRVTALSLAGLPC